MENPPKIARMLPLLRTSKILGEDEEKAHSPCKIKKQGNPKSKGKNQDVFDHNKGQLLFRGAVSTSGFFTEKLQKEDYHRRT